MGIVIRIFFSLINFYRSIVPLQYGMFLLYTKVNQLYVYIYPLFFGFLFYLGHHTALNRVP